MTDSSKIRVLIAEDEGQLAEVLSGFLRGRGFNVRLVGDGRSAVTACGEEFFDVALVDVMMPALDGLSALKAIRERRDPPEVIVMTGNGSIESALAAMKQGAFDYLTKPFPLGDLEEVVRRAWQKRRLARESRSESTAAGRPGIVTRFAAMHAVLSLVERIATTDAPVLIAGEPGTGKTSLARTIHRLSERGGQFVDVDCAAFTDDQLCAELVGAPGAGSDGAVTTAVNGTLFLDEISTIGPGAQEILSRALNRAASAGGPERPARFVAATARRLPAVVQEGRFRADLYARLASVTVELPPLRERIVDIPLLADHFLLQFGGATAPTLTPDAVTALEEYRWPGNVRELRVTIERAVTSARSRGGGDIRAQDLHLGSAPVPPSTIGGTLEELERSHIESTLDRVHWHQGRAAERLGISAKTLYRKIREYGLVRPRGAADDSGADNTEGQSTRSV